MNLKKPFVFNHISDGELSNLVKISNILAVLVSFVYGTKTPHGFGVHVSSPAFHASSRLHYSRTCVGNRY